jgi:hydrogenase nickel incorporation protein HypB
MSGDAKSNLTEDEGAIRVVAIKEIVLADNKKEADTVRDQLREKGTLMLDVMGSPGAGKTTFILNTIARLRGKYSFGVIEGDIASTIDAKIMLKAGIDVPMINEALNVFDKKHDVIIVENVGNLVCPAEFDTGAHIRIMLLSVPEGYDKVFKYPLMFTVVDALIISKCDTLPVFDDYNVEAVKKEALRLNKKLTIFEVSAKSNVGMEPWVCWLNERIEQALSKE